MVATAVLFGGLLLVTGTVDLDWMVTSYYFQIGNGLNGFWSFTPSFALPWWDAYFVSITRIIFGAGSLGAGLGYLFGRRD